MDRFYIFDCRGQIVGNPKGYASIKSAEKMMNTPSSKVYAQVWDTFFAQDRDSDKDYGKGYTELVYKVKAKDKTVIIGEARP